jgi:hypothetical protein
MSLVTKVEGNSELTTVADNGARNSGRLTIASVTREGKMANGKST